VEVGFTHSFICEDKKPKVGKVLGLTISQLSITAANMLITIKAINLLWKLLSTIYGMFPGKIEFIFYGKFTIYEKEIGWIDIG
jgi:hypothetical protein